MKALPVYFFIFLTIVSLTGCDDDEKKALVIPAEYDGTAYEGNAAAEITLGQMLTTLSTEAKKGRTGGEVSQDALQTLYTTGSPSLKSITSTYYSGKLEGTSGFMAELAKASGGNTYTPGQASESGGTYGGYLFDENGLELEQLIEKGLFGAALYNHAVTLLSGELTPATPDRVIAIFGAHPSFPSSNDASKHEHPDKFIASYTARRDKNDGKGFYSQIKNNLIKLQAAIKAGDDYRKEQQDAIEAIKENWEKANAATIINYLHSVISTLSNTTVTDQQKAGALHSYSECVGFLHGWRNLPQAHKIITDAEIDELLTLLNAPADGVATSYKFATNPEQELLKLLEVIDELQDIYDFTDQEIEEFRKNWVAEQGR